MMHGRLRATARIAALALVAVLAAAAVALAATGSPGKYKGKTSQKEPVHLHVGTNGNVSHFDITWIAPCTRDPSKHWGPDSTKNKGAIVPASDGSFRRSGTYKRTDRNGYTGHFKATMKGQFTSSTKAKGTFHVRVRVTKNGSYVDTCKTTVKWHAHQ